MKSRKKVDRLDGLTTNAAFRFKQKRWGWRPPVTISLLLNCNVSFSHFLQFFQKWSSDYRFYSLHFHSLFFSLSLSHSSSSFHFPFFVTQPRAVVPILVFFIVVSLGTFQSQSCFFFSLFRFRFVFLSFIPQLPSVLCLFSLFFLF